MTTKKRRKSDGEKWVKEKIKRPGQLHRDLGIPQGEKIPVSKIREAAKRKGKVGERARFALTLRKFNKRKKKKSRSTRSTRSR